MHLTAAVAGAGAVGVVLLGESSASALGAALARYCGAPRLQAGAAALEPPGAGWELAQVQVLVRHGARSAIHRAAGVRANFSCALSGEVEALLGRWPRAFQVADAGAAARGADRAVRRTWRPAAARNGTCAPGQLTDAGFRQLLDLGAQLRRAYGRQWADPGRTAPGEVYARSTDFQRTRASVAALLSGVLDLPRGLPEKMAQIPIYVHTDPLKEVMVGVGLAKEFSQVNEAARPGAPPGGRGSPCPRATELAARQAAAFSPAPGTLEGAAAALGGSPVAGVTEAADAFYSAGCEGDALAPATAAAGHIARVLSEADRKYRERYVGEEGGANATRLAFQPLLAEVLGRLRRAAAGAGPRLAVLGGHDTVVAPVAAALGFFDSLWPPLAAHIIFELWRSPAGAAGVRLRFNGRAVTGELPACRAAAGAEVCPLEIFADAVASLLGGHETLEEACAA